MNHPLDPGTREANPGSLPPFFHALKAGPGAFADLDALIRLLKIVHGDTLLCAITPAPSVLEHLNHRGVSVLASLTHPPLAPSEFATREEWAAAMLHSYEEAFARRAPGICLAHAEPLLEDESGYLRWHVACCYRAVRSNALHVPVASWDPRIRIPVRRLPSTQSLSELEVQWELLDGIKIVGRGTAQSNIETAEVMLQLRGAVHPDNWTEEPRIRLHFHLPAPQPPRPTGATIRGGDVLVLRRPAPVEQRATADQQLGTPIQLAGVGPEVSRIEVGLDMQLPVECTLRPTPRAAHWPGAARVEVRLENRTSSLQEVELRLTLHPEQGPARSVLTQTSSIPATSSVIRRVWLPESMLGQGANYLLAGFRYTDGVGLKTCLIHRSEAPDQWTYYRNDERSRVSFWDVFPAGGGRKLIRRVTLEGGEERVFPSQEWEAPPLADQEPLLAVWTNIRLEYGMEIVEPSSRGDWKMGGSGAMKSILVWKGGNCASATEGRTKLEGTLHPYGPLVLRWRWSLRNRATEARPMLLLSFPDEWQQVQWSRDALWDVYPPSHPDRPTGSTQLPVELSQVRRAIVHGMGGGLVLLAGKQKLNIVFSAGQLRIAPSCAPEGGRAGDYGEFALFFVNNTTEAKGMSWKRPAGVVRSVRGRSIALSTLRPASGE